VGRIIVIIDEEMVDSSVRWPKNEEKSARTVEASPPSVASSSLSKRPRVESLAGDDARESGDCEGEDEEKELVQYVNKRLSETRLEHHTKTVIVILNVAEWSVSMFYNRNKKADLVAVLERPWGTQIDPYGTYQKLISKNLATPGDMEGVYSAAVVIAANLVMDDDDNINNDSTAISTSTLDITAPSMQQLSMAAGDGGVRTEYKKSLDFCRRVCNGNHGK
jgi:hypothetical protein